MRRVILVAIAGLLAACGGASDPVTDPDEPAPRAPNDAGVAVCEELEWFTGPEELYGDTPVYVGNEMPIEAVTAYSRGMDGFVEAWIDREHNGWINVGFVDVDLAAAQEELSGAFSGEGVVAVRLPFTEEQLEQVRRRVAAALPDDFDASNFHVLHGRVEVWVGTLTEENIARVDESVDDEPVCVSGRDPATTPEPGPQPPGGDGWSYLGEFDVSLGTATTVVMVGSSDDYVELWSSLGGAADPPAVDFDGHVVAAVETGYSGSCPETRLDEITFSDSEVALVINTITDEMACTDDYNPRVYVVALQREHLPEPPFVLGRHDAPALMVQFEEDLRVPGAEPGRPRPAPDPEPQARLPSFIEPGFPWDAVIDVGCGIEWLGEVNGVHWRTDGELPDEWETFVDDDQLLEVRLLLTEGPDPTLTVTAGNHDMVYLPSDPPPDPCPGAVP